jgi:hypothetical protein
MVDAKRQLQPVPHRTSIANMIILGAMWPYAFAVALSTHRAKAQVRPRSAQCEEETIRGSEGAWNEQQQFRHNLLALSHLPI